MINNYTILNSRTISRFGSWQSNEWNSPHSLFGLRKMWFVILLFALNLISLQTVTAQVSFLQNFNTDAGSFTGGFSRFTGTTACGGSGGAMRLNLYSFVTSGELISPNTGTANGTSAQIITYDYKAANWSANTAGTNPWGSFEVQYSSSASGPWTTIATVSNETQNGSCISKSHTFTPPAGDLFIRFSATWSSGDYYLNFDNVAVSLAPTTAPACTTGLLPATGATQIARNATLNWNNLIGADGYKLYFGTSPSPGFVTTVAGTSYSPPVLSANTTYYWKVVPTNGNGDAVGCIEQSFTTGSNFTYCTAIPTSMDANGITNVQFGTFSNPNVSPLTYQDFRALAPESLLRTLTVPITVSLATGYTYNVRVFIDYNQDGDFNDANENNLIGLSTNTNPTSISGNLIIPADAVLGNTVMRIVATDDDFSDNACYSSSYANVEDYTVNIAQPVLCENTPNAGVASISQNSGCAGGSLNLSATGVSGGALGLSYKWQSSSDDVSWTDIPSATNLTYTVSASNAGTTYYRLFTSCSYSGLSNFSNSVSFNGITCGSFNVPSSGNSLVDCGTNTFIYDIGGSSADYVVSTNGYLVLDNSGTGVITLSGNVLGMESCCDDIFIYSGVGTGGTLLANYTSAGAITTIVSAPGQPITIQFVSDTSVVGPGFAFQAIYSGTCLTCTTPVAGTASAATSTYCNSGSTTISSTGYSEGTGTRYQWESSTDNFATPGVAIGSVSNSYANLTTGTLTTTTSYRLKVFCIANPSDVAYSTVATVTINFPGTIDPVIGAAVCANEPATLSATSAGAVSFAWTAPGGYTNTGSSIVVNTSSTTIYTVTATYANSCTASTTTTVTVLPTPSVITVTPSASTVCNTTAVTLTANGSNVSTSSTYSAVGSTPITDFVYNTLPVTVAGLPASAVISKIEVVFNVTHTWDSDVQLNLQSPNGKIVNLVSSQGGSLDNFTNTTVTSDLTAPAFSSGTAPFTNGVYTASLLDLAVLNSTTNFSELFAAPFNGTWTIQTYDVASGDTGTLNSASIRIYYSAPSNTTWTASSGTLYTSVNPDVAYVSGESAAVLYARPSTASTYTATASLGGCTSTGSTSVAVNQLPVFSVAPITICNGTTGTLVASSLESNSYAWTPVGGGATLSGASVFVNPSATTTYNVTATSNTTVPACSSTQQVTVTVNEPGTIVSGTASRTISPGQITTFEVVTTGLVSYQWQVNDNVNGWQDILAANPDYSGETTAVLSLQNVTLGFDTYQYRCLVTGLAPCVTLTPIEAVLNVTNTGFSTQPVSVNLCGQSSTTFSVVTTGDEPYNVQWQMSTDGGASFNDILDGFDASGLTFSGVNDFSPKTLSVSGITTAHSTYQFKCQLDFFLDSSIATLTVNSPVTLTNNFSTTPVIRCSAPSAAATSFGISTTGSVASVEWKYATSASGPWITIAAGTPAGASYSGATSNTLLVTTTAATPVGNYYYKAFVTGAGSGANKCGDAQSDVATVTVVNPTITVSPSSAAYCTPGPAVTLTASGSNINSYSWTASGFTTTTGTSIAVTPSAATTYTVTGTDSNGCTNTAQATVTVGGAFTLAATSSATTLCPGNLATLNATPTPLSGVSYLVNTTPYQFNATSGSFTPLTGTVSTAVASLSDDTNSASLPIGFSFNFGGTSYTNFRVNSNGLFSFGAGNSTATNALTSTTAGVRPGIAPLWDDLQCSSSGVTYQVSGASPNRVLTVEWLNMEWNWSSSQSVISFQVKLYEGSNAVELVYRSEAQAGNPAGSSGASVGLMGTAGANFVSLQDLTASPVISTTTSANGLATKPASGQTYRFTPVAPVTYTYAWSSLPSGLTATTAGTSANPTVNTTYNVSATSNSGCTASASVAVAVDSAAPVITTQPLTQQLCQGATATLSVVASSATALSYQWYKDGVAITGNASATTATLSLTGTTPASSGSYTVTVTNCTTVTSNAAVLTVYPTPTAVAPVAQAYCINATVPATPLTGTPSGVTFNISGGAALGLANQTGVTEIPSFAPTAAGTATISITPVANGCNGTAVTYNLTINPLPTAPVLTSNSAICEGSALNFNSTVAVQQGYSLNSNSNVAFIDISATGTSVGTISDDSEHNITIPSFTFNTVAYTTARVGNNGVFVFGATAGDINYSNLTLPSGLNFNGSGLMSNTVGASLAAICALWDDLTPGTGGSIKTQTVGSKFIVQWTQEDNFGATGTGTVTFQIQLDSATNQIHLVYPDVIYGVVGYDNAATATIGLNYSATAALQYSYNTASILNGQSLTFTPAAYSYAWSGPNGFTSALPNPSLANATPSASGNYTLEITNGNGCKSSSTIAALVNPTPSAVAPANQLYYNGLATAAIPLTGTPSGVTFDISGGTSIGLADATGLTTIPSFVPVAGSATVTITPKANGCTGPSVSYDIVVSAVSTNSIANQTYCQNATTSAIPLTASPASLSTDVGVTFNIIGGASVGLADVTGVTAIPSFVPTTGSATIFVYPVYGGVIGGFATATITVNPLPTATISGSTAVCQNDTAPIVTFTGATGTAPYTFTYKFNGGSNQTIVSSGNTATIAQPTGTAGTFAYTLVSVQDSSSTTCTNAQAGTATIVVHPTPTVAAVPNRIYYSGFATTAIPLTGTPSGVTFNISGGSASGLADVNGVTTIPSFIPTTTASTVTITPVANGCVGVAVTYQIAFNPVVVNLSNNEIDDEDHDHDDDQDDDEPFVCGGLNFRLNRTIYCTRIRIPGYTVGYRFEVTNVSTGEVQYVDKYRPRFKLTDLTNYSYGTTFTIRAAAILNGNVQGFFGSVCTLTTRFVSTSQVISTQCGETFLFMNSNITAVRVRSTNLYRFRVSLASDPTTYYYVQRTVPNFNLTQVVGLPLYYNTEYLVDIQARVKLSGIEAWSQFGQRCSIFTPEAPESAILASQCEDYAVPTMTTQINAVTFPGATAYRFRLTAYDEFGDVSYQQTVTNATASYTLSQFTGLIPGATYTVGVSMQLFGTFTEYGKDCTVIVPLITKNIATDFKATAYPNPFAANFMIDVKTSSNSVIAIKVYDMVGRLIEQKSTTVAELENTPIGNNYPSGVYNVVVTQDETVQTVRVVKR